jgi:hypothetical protein
MVLWCVVLCGLLAGSTAREIPAASSIRVEEAADRPTSKTVLFVCKIT